MVSRVSLLHAVLYGIVQGITEFFPVSSNAHLRILQAWIDPHYSASAHYGAFTAFSGALQIGTALAMLMFFWRELLHVSVAWVRGLVDPTVRDSLECRLGWYLIVVTIPVAIAGLLLNHSVNKGIHDLWVSAISLIAVGVILFGAERLGSRTRVEEDIDTTDAAVLGVAMGLALIPGTSRPGTMISAGMFRGMTREAAARFSFLLSLPVVVLSAAFQARKIGEKGAPGAGLTGLGMLFALIFGLLALRWVLSYLREHSTYVFIGYRLALGGLLVGLLASGTLAAG